MTNSSTVLLTQVVFRAGDAGDKFYIVLSGILNVEVATPPSPHTILLPPFFLSLSLSLSISPFLSLCLIYMFIYIYMDVFY